jgi:oxalate decarboxylase
MHSTPLTRTHTDANACVLPQSLGLPADAAAALAAGLAKSGGASKPSVMASFSDTAAVVTSQAPLVPQQPPLSHKYSLSLSPPDVSSSDGSTITKVEVTRFPVSEHMAGAVLRIKPGGMRQLHWHLNFNEWQFMLSGEVEGGVFLGPNQGNILGMIREGDVAFAPRGSGHYVINKSADKEAVMVLIFDSGEFTNVDANNFLGSFPSAWLAASLSADMDLVKRIQYNLSGFAPAAPKRSG